MPVYFIQATNGGPVKIGKALDVHTRLVQHRSDTGWDLIVLGVMDGYTELEKELHGRFSRYRIRRSEWFEPAPPIFDFIAAHAVPFESCPPRKCIGNNLTGHPCGAYVMDGSDYCFSHHPDCIRPSNPQVKVTLGDSLLKAARKKAGMAPLPAVARILLKKWLSGQIKIDYTDED